jgi:LmbE family N-acetylglucosaminyl deacetylase
MVGGVMKVLLLAPHADDELLGAGGMLLRMKNEGHEVLCVLVALSDIQMNGVGLVTRGTRGTEFINSCKVLCTEKPVLLNYIDSKLDTVPISGIIKDLEGVIEFFHPDIVLIPEPSFHQDHQVVHRAGIAALRPMGIWQPSQILLYEVPNSRWHNAETAFTPNYYVDIHDTIEEKKRLFKDAYASQLRFIVRNETGIETQARYRGYEAGCEYAEAFYLLKEVRRCATSRKDLIDQIIKPRVEKC